MIVPGVNAVVDVLRDAASGDADGFGDEVETGSTAVLTGVPAFIFEESQQQPVDGDLRVIRMVRGRVAAGTDVRVGDRLRDGAGAVYSVTTVTEPQLGMNRPPLYRRLELMRSS